MKDQIKKATQNIENLNICSNNNNNNNNDNNKLKVIESPTLSFKKSDNKEKKEYIYKEPIKDYTRFFSERSSTPCQLTEIEISTFLVSDEIYSFGAGVPSKHFFPVKELEFKFNYLDSEKVSLTRNELETIQQYSDTPGLPNMLDWCRRNQMRYHGLCDPNTKGKEWDCVMTPGSQHALDCVFKVFMNRGDTMICERYTYGGMFGIAHPGNVFCAPVVMDDRGMIPSELENLLENWSTIMGEGKRFPKLLYLIPHGQNPTGVIYDTQRKIEIYEIACKFDLLIVEDDPHFLMQLDNEIDETTGRRKLYKSFLTIDKENRVIRLDTFSKFLSSGIRMGYVTTNSNLIGSIAFELNASVFHSSGLTQITLQKLFASWGDDGFDKHVEKVQQLLIQKRKDTIELLEKHLKGQIEYNIPKSGLYFWVKLKGIDCSYTFVRDALIQHKVLFGLGISSSPDRTVKTPYIRITFSYLDKEDGEVAFKTLSNCLKNYIENKSNINNKQDVFYYNKIS